MSTRFDALFDHVSIKSNDTPEIKALKQSVMLQAIRAEFDLSSAKMKEMAMYMIYEMNIGLEKPMSEDPKIKPASTLKMLPSYVYRENPSADGSFFALDLGGTNFRIIRMKVVGNILQYVNQKSFVITSNHMRGNAEGLFGFVADCLKNFMAEIHYVPDVKNPDKLGFTFSFPVKQNGINQGTLVSWTKGFTTEGVVGKDVCKLLQIALNKKDINIELAALCNDTVGTLITRYFSDMHCEMGLILGTGVNGCYWERCNKITKYPNLCKDEGKEMVINMEFGNFDSNYIHVLPVTTFDQDIDKFSVNPGSQIYEKMVSGMYLGEIVRRILVSLSTCGALSPSFRQQLDGKQYLFTAHDCGEIAGDRLPGLFTTQDILLKHYNIDCSVEHERYVIRELCELVGKRSAQLAGMAIGATLLKIGKVSNATVAVDGSVYENIPYYEGALKNAVKCVVGEEANIRVELTKGGSGLGAGYISALVSA